MKKLDSILTKTLGELVERDEENEAEARLERKRNSPTYRICRTCKFIGRNLSEHLICTEDGLEVQEASTCGAWEEAFRFRNK